VGVEHLRISAPAQTGAISGALFGIGNVDAAMDGWIQDVVALDTENSVLISQNVKRFTVKDLSILRTTVADGSAGYPLEVQWNGSQILVMGGTIKGDKPLHLRHRCALDRPQRGPLRQGDGRAHPPRAARPVVDRPPCRQRRP
jgi:hypothetical protein